MAIRWPCPLSARPGCARPCPSSPWAGRAAGGSLVGFSYGSALGVVSAAVAAGARPVWWAGGPAAVPLRVRLARRSAACVRSVCCARPGPPCPCGFSRPAVGRVARGCSACCVAGCPRVRVLRGLRSSALAPLCRAGVGRQRLRGRRVRAAGGRAALGGRVREGVGGFTAASCSVLYSSSCLTLPDEVQPVSPRGRQYEGRSTSPHLVGNPACARFGWTNIVFGQEPPGSSSNATSSGNGVYLPLIGQRTSFLPTIIPSTTNSLPPDTLDQLLSVSADGVTFTFDSMTTALAAVAPGEVIVAAPSAGAPDGFLRRVTAISASGGDVVIQTQPATLEGPRSSKPTLALPSGFRRRM